MRLKHSLFSRRRARGAGLLTLRGAELLGRAMWSSHAGESQLLRLVPEKRRDYLRRQAVKEHAIPQDELNHLLISKAGKENAWC
jgi:siroheme synthase